MCGKAESKGDYTRGGCSSGVKDGSGLYGPCTGKRESIRQQTMHHAMVCGVHYFSAYTYNVLCCLFSS